MEYPTESEAARRVLHGTFGIETFRGGQEDVILALLAGSSALAVFPTGSGKSLCYQLPALLLDGLTLVVSPLIALMKDQVEKLNSLGIGAARIDSTLADDEIDEVFAQISSGATRLLYLSPERLAGSAFRQRLKDVHIPLMAIDEAHCISEWGHNFRPDYLKIASLARRMRVKRVLALTATATPQVIRDIRKGFRIPMAACFRTGVLRPNLRINVTACEGEKRDALLLEKLQEIAGPVIVYATTRQATESIATFLQKKGVSAGSYHAGLTSELRSRVQDAFMQNTLRVVVATTAFGMGIDKPDIRAVIHYHLPKCLEGYSQETGRGGRDGLPARCELLACRQDTLTLENFVHGSTPSPQALRNLLDRILRLTCPGRLFAISPYELSISNDMRVETVRTVLASLELAGIILRCGAWYDDFRIKPLLPMDRILAGRPTREKTMIRKLFAEAVSERGSLRLKLQESSDKIGISRQKAGALITSLAEAGDIRLEQRGLREIYQTDKSWDGSITGIIADMSRRFESRARYEHDRIQSVIAYTETRKCRAVFLSKYFGHHNTPPCGNCDLCLGENNLRLAALRTPEIPDHEWEAMTALRAMNHVALGTSAQLARFLCGIPSPMSNKERLNRHPEFGIWQHHRYSDILRMLEA